MRNLPHGRAERGLTDGFTGHPETLPAAHRGGARLVGTAETSSRKGHDRIAAVVDATSGRTIHACAGHGKGTIARFADDLMDRCGDPGAIFWACIDMSSAGIVAYPPNAHCLPQSWHRARPERGAAGASGGSERKRGRTCHFERADSQGRDRRWQRRIAQELGQF